MTDRDAHLIARRARVLGPAYRLFYDRPLHLVRGRGTLVWDAEGREYLDAYNNVPSVGHCHPRVVEALSRQAALLNTHTRYLHDGVVDYAERLVATFPAPLSQVMLTCTGSEANDLALRVARVATGATGVIVTRNAYHGVTATLAELSPSLGPDNPLGAHVRLVAAPDTYRLGEDGARRAFLDGIRDAMESLREAGLRPAALLCDTVFASDGLFVEPRGLLAEAAALVRKAGGLFVADEVQAGLGRVGSHLWAFGRHGVVPDLVTLGKPLGDGHPLAAMVARPDLLARFGARARYFNTFGGTPVSAAVGLAVLETIEEEGLLASAEAVGGRMLAGLREVASRHPLAGDVRGTGLYAAVEIVSDAAARVPAPALLRRLLDLMREEGVLVGSCGLHANCLKIRPPLCFSDADAGRMLAVLDGTLARLAAEGTAA